MDDHIKDLKNLGIAENEAKVYLKLLAKNHSAVELSKLLNINRTNIYKIVNRLIEKGFCRKTTGNGKFTALSPELAFSSLIEELNQKIDLVEKKTLELESIFDNHQVNENPDTVKILYSKASIEDTVCKLESKAEKEVLAFCKEPYVMNINQLDKFKSSMNHSISLGVVHKAIYHLNSDDYEMYEILKTFSKLGEEIRIVEYLPLKLIVFDAKIVVLTFENKLDNTTFTSLTDEDVAKTFKMIFEVYWNNATPLEQYLKQ